MDWSPRSACVAGCCCRRSPPSGTGPPTNSSSTPAEKPACQPTHGKKARRCTNSRPTCFLKKPELLPQRTQRLTSQKKRGHRDILFKMPLKGFFRVLCCLFSVSSVVKGLAFSCGEIGAFRGSSRPAG